jgi:hypothetical protein
VFAAFLVAVDTSVAATDSDGDGLTDTTENNLGTDQNNPDTDSNGTIDRSILTVRFKYSISSQFSS